MRWGWVYNHNRDLIHGSITTEQQLWHFETIWHPWRLCYSVPGCSTAQCIWSRRMGGDLPDEWGTLLILIIMLQRVHSGFIKTVTRLSDCLPLISLSLSPPPLQSTFSLSLCHSLSRFFSLSLSPQPLQNSAVSLLSPPPLSLSLSLSLSLFLTASYMRCSSIYLGSEVCHRQSGMLKSSPGGWSKPPRWS